MDLRRLCNVAYAFLTEGADADGVKLIDAALEGKTAAPDAPGVLPAAKPDNSGARSLMAAMMIPQKA